MHDLKLAKEIGAKQAAAELNVPPGTLHGWLKKEEIDEIDLGLGSRTPSNLQTLAAEIKALREKVRQQDKEILRVTKINAFLEEASRFYAQSQQKSEKSNALLL